MSNATHSEPDQAPPDSARPSRLAWWLHPKVALPLTLFVLILLAPLLYRSYRISSIPDIGDPFDVAAFEAIVVPASDNAAEIYAAANKLRVKGTYSSDDLERVFENGWEETTEPVQKWLTANEPALDEWRRATERPTAQFVMSKEMWFASPTPSVSELREFTNLARLRAERCLHGSDIEGAWSWLLASLRGSRHFGQHGKLLDRLIGAFNFSTIAHSVNRWAADPRVDENHLRKAEEDFDAVDAMTPMNSIPVKYEYLSCLHTFERGLTLEDLGATPAAIGVSESVLSPVLYFSGDPEYSRRLTQQVFSDWLEQIDLPKWKRAPIASVRFGLYSTAAKPGRLSVSELESRLLSVSLARELLPLFSRVAEHLDREFAKRMALKLTLAAQRYYRLNGDWPGKLEDLVPSFLIDLPDDPFGKAGETLQLKRDADGLIIYSLGSNDFDDGGAVRLVELSKSDEGFRLKRPRSPSAEK